MRKRLTSFRVFDHHTHLWAFPAAGALSLTKSGRATLIDTFMAR